MEIGPNAKDFAEEVALLICSYLSGYRPFPTLKKHWDIQKQKELTITKVPFECVKLLTILTRNMRGIFFLDALQVGISLTYRYDLIHINYTPH